MTCYPDTEKRPEEKAQRPSSFRMRIVLGSILFIATMVVPSLAVDSVNWTQITDLLDGVQTIMPSITGIISSVITPMILLVVVGFVLGIFKGLLRGIENALNFNW